jgi:hypothetical protein
MAPYNTVITMLITYIVYLSIISDIVSDELKSTRVKPHTRQTMERISENRTAYQQIV